MKEKDIGNVFDPKLLCDYPNGGIVSMQLLKNATGNITLFAFAKGQGLSKHSAPFDVFVQILEGEVEITIGEKPLLLSRGDCVIMPANVPHSVKAMENFKMLLTMLGANGE